MQIFIDTADLSEIERYAHIIDGVTTNPTLISRLGTNTSTEEVVRKISDTVSGPVSVEVISEDCDGMVAEARQFASLSPNIVIKIPMNEEGLKATRALKELKIKTNVTLIFSANQALLAAKAGASYVSIFIGRLDDLGNDGMDVVRDTTLILNNYSMGTEVIAASIRHPMHVLDSARAGCHIATIPPNIIALMMKHPLTDAGIEAFLKDAKIH